VIPDTNLAIAFLSTLGTSLWFCLQVSDGTADLSTGHTPISIFHFWYEIVHQDKGEMALVGLGYQSYLVDIPIQLK
jgi:hypothetical protein